MPFTKGNIIPHKDKCTCFRCGGVVWNKGKKGIHLSVGSEWKKGEHVSPQTEIKKGQRLSPNTEFKRTNKKLSYGGLHGWVYRKLGKAKFCDKCFITTNIQWANKSHKYLEDPNDWIQLCVRCHSEYDQIGKKTWESRRKNGTVRWGGKK